MKNFTLTILFFTFMFSSNSFAQSSTANYTITFASVWESVANDATDGISTIALPGNPHWSPLIGATHKTANTFLMMNAAASSGIESMAETGAVTTLKNEIESNADADQYIPGPGLESGLGSARGTITINNITVSEDYPLITLVSMIAPSPDWFIGVNSRNLRSGNIGINDGWEPTFSVDLFPYDAGTEDGTGYSGSNNDTSGVITSRSNTVPFNSNKIGTITFTYNSSTLSTSTTNTIENIKIFPNPTKGNLTVSNIQNIDLKTVELYSIIGKLVKQIPTSKSNANINLDISDINSGIYLLKLNTIDGQSKIQKIVINL